MTIAHVASGRPIAAIEAELEGGGYGTLKKLTVEAVNEMLAPLQRRYREYMDDRAGLDAVLARGAERAREIAGPTLRRAQARSEEHTSELQSRENLVCRLLL